MARGTNSLTLRAALDPGARLSSWFESLRAHIVAWASTCADSYAATAMYEQLSRLSDAELGRRGITRGDLHRWVFDELARPAIRGTSITDRKRD